MKLSQKQKEVIRTMRRGNKIYNSGGMDATVGYSGGFRSKISSPTFHKLLDLKLIEKDKKKPKYVSLMTYYILTPLGKTIEL